MNYKTRDEVENIYKWDLESRYQTLEDWEKDFRKTKKEISKITTYKGKLLENAETLFDALECYYIIHGKILKLYIYANSLQNSDLANNDNGLLVSRITAVYSKFMQDSSYIEPEILKGSISNLNKLIKNKKLSKYRFYLEDTIRNKDHLLTEAEEVIISKLTENIDAFEKINEVLKNSVLDYGKIIVDGEEVQITNSNYRVIMTNKNRETRKECYDLLTSKLEEFTNIFAPSLIAHMKTLNSLADIRKFSTLLEMDLFTSNIPKEVYNNLFKTVESRLDVLRKYFKMIKTHLGLNELEYYDVNTELVNTDLSFTIEEAKLIIQKSLGILGKEYTDALNKAFDEKWIDYATYKGKMSGAYATTNYGNHPLILTNYCGKFQDVSAIAHELGHAVNYHFSMENNHEHDFDTDTFVAEVASLTNEILLCQYIITNSTDKNLKLAAIYNLLHTIQDNIFDACIEEKLEHEMYKVLDKGEEINSDLLSQTIINIRKEYYGSAVKLDEKLATYWMRRVHYFMPYYLFKYATGMSAAIYVAKKIINNEDNMKEKYLEFLTKGSTNYPTELLKEMGLDMTKPKVINEAIDYMDYLIDEFNKVSEEY